MSDNNRELAAHLGGHDNETHVDEGALQYLIETFDIKSAIDIGCGPGGMVELMRAKNLDAVGVDGDDVVVRPDSVKEFIEIWDYSKGEYNVEKTGRRQFDLGWSVEFVEHVEKKFMPNFLATFKGCKYVAMTHAIPGQWGHHHVNLMPAEYWFGALDAIGFELLINESNLMRQRSTMKNIFIRQHGLLFKNLHID